MNYTPVIIYSKCLSKFQKNLINFQKEIINEDLLIIFEKINILIIQNKNRFNNLKNIFLMISQNKRKSKDKLLKDIFNSIVDNYILIFMIINFIFHLSTNKITLNKIIIEITIKHFLKINIDLNKTVVNLEKKCNIHDKIYSKKLSEKNDLFEKAFLKYDNIIKDNKHLMNKFQVLIDNLINFIFDKNSNLILSKNIDFFKSEITNLKNLKNIKVEEIKIENEFFHNKYLNNNKEKKIFCEECTHINRIQFTGDIFFKNLSDRIVNYNIKNIKNLNVNKLISFYEKQLKEINNNLYEIEEEFSGFRNVENLKFEGFNFKYNSKNEKYIRLFKILNKKISFYEKLLFDISNLENLQLENYEEYNILIFKEKELTELNIRLERKILTESQKFLKIISEKQEEIDNLKKINLDFNEKITLLEKNNLQLNYEFNEKINNENFYRKLNYYKICDEVKHAYEINLIDKQEKNLLSQKDFFFNKKNNYHNYSNLSNIFPEFLEKSISSFTKEDTDLFKYYNTEINNLNNNKINEINFTNANTQNFTNEISGRKYHEFLYKMQNDKKSPFLHKFYHKNQKNLFNDNKKYNNISINSYDSEKNLINDEYYYDNNFITEDAQLLLNEIYIYKKILSEKEDTIINLEKKIINLREDIQSFNQKKFNHLNMKIKSKYFEYNTSNDYSKNAQIRQLEEELVDFKLMNKHLNEDLKDKDKILEEKEEIICFKEKLIDQMMKELNNLKKKNNIFKNESYYKIEVIIY